MKYWNHAFTGSARKLFSVGAALDTLGAGSCRFAPGVRRSGADRRHCLQRELKAGNHATCHRDRQHSLSPEKIMKLTRLRHAVAFSIGFAMLTACGGGGGGGGGAFVPVSTLPDQITEI